MEEIKDVGLLDKVTRHRKWLVEKDSGKVTTREQQQEHPIPEEYMTKLESHIGDAGARVTVGAELSNMRDFNKAQAFVSVTVTCNNKAEDIENVHNIALEMVKKLVNEDLKMMKVDRDLHIDGEAEGKVTSPPRANAKPVVATKPGVQRPAFRR